MAWSLYGTKSLSSLMLAYCQLDLCFRNKFHRNFNLNTTIFIQEIDFENATPKMAAISSQPQTSCILVTTATRVGLVSPHLTDDSKVIMISPCGWYLTKLTILASTVWCSYSVVGILQNIHNRQPITSLITHKLLDISSPNLTQICILPTKTSLTYFFYVNVQIPRSGGWKVCEILKLPYLCQYFSSKAHNIRNAHGNLVGVFKFQYPGPPLKNFVTTSKWRPFWKCQNINYNMVGVTVTMGISTMYEKSCIDSYNARKFEKSSKIQSVTHLAITKMKLRKHHSHEFLKLS